MARWASLIDKRKTKNPAILLDAGGFCNPDQGKNAAFDADYFFEGMRMIGYAAAGVGPDDIRFGRKRLAEKAREAGFVLLSSNVYDKRGSSLLGADYTVIRVGGRRTLTGIEGGVKIGVFSVVLPLFVHEIDPDISLYYEVLDPRIAALAAVSALREKGCDLIVALSYQSWPASLDLAGSVDGIDIVINGRREHNSPTGEMVGRTMVVDTGIRRISLTEVLVEWKAGSPRIAVKEAGPEAKSLKGRNDLLELEKKYEHELRERGIRDAREGS
jgi:2',3'-cyclic-nucleotide 2'-phosphodiesterase (5'-nucleotidase family)